MSGVKSASISCAFAIVVSLALARVHPFGDAGLYAARAAEKPIMERSSVPPEVRAILASKCADCHSLQSRSPLYGRFAPASWLMERDIKKGREAMNLTLWESFPAAQQQSFAARIAQQAKTHEMPPLQYRLIHWNTRITDADIRTMSNWARATSGSEPGRMDQAAGEGDPVRGKDLFEKRCTGCHSLTQNREGPRLQGVYGRTSGSVEDYAYSGALKKAQIVWDEKSLDQWLTDPDAFIGGNNMDFLVYKPQERRDLISFLRQGVGK